MRETGLDILSDVGGTFLIAVGTVCFAESVQIAPGGVSGLALCMRHLWGMPVGTSALLLNIPLFLVGWNRLGGQFLKRTLRTLLLAAVMTDGIVAQFLPRYTGDRLLGAICAGILSGLGLAVVFLRGSTTGGTDILSRLLGIRFPQLSFGTALMVVDGLVLALSIPVFGDWESGLLGAVALYGQTRMLGQVLYGAERGGAVLILSDKSEAIAEKILHELHRGATFLPVRGAYTRQRAQSVFTVIRFNEFHRLKQIVHACDERAFLVALEARQILGEGFQAR